MPVPDGAATQALPRSTAGPARARRAGRLLGASLAALTLLLLAASGAATAKTLKLATVMPDGSSWLVEMKAAGKQIEADTAGRVKIKFYPGGVMGNDKTVMRKIRAGQLQGGAFTSGALAPSYPDIDLYSLPLLFRSFDEVDAVRAKIDPTLKAGLEAAGFVPLAFTDGGFAYIASQKPLRRVEDLAGVKVWMPEGDVMSQTAFEVAGVAPVPLPIADVYTALQTGLVDTVGAPPAGLIAFQWHTKVKYFTDVPLMYLIGILAVDTKSFSTLSPEDQKIVRDRFATAAVKLDAENRAGDQNARDALKKQGIEFIEASSEEEKQRWQKMSEDTRERLRAMDRYDNALIDEILMQLETYRAGATAAP
jgi:TRAP-type C4-dicarboxylate transport system substrate-binding protein